MRPILKRILLCFITFIYISKSLVFSSQEPEYIISLLTYSSGAELYSSFGHSALRVIDKSDNTDYVYNYGTFDFDTPGFYTKFINGRLPYRLSRSRTARVLKTGKRENVTISENRLILTREEAIRMNKFLENNYLPENRAYLYDFFYDNCATRIINIIDSVTYNRFENNSTSYVPKSFVRLFKPYLKEKGWAEMGIQILIGAAGYKKASLIETTFLPDYLLSYIKNSVASSNTPLVEPDTVLISSRPMPGRHSFFSPGITFMLILSFAIFIRFKEIKSGKLIGNWLNYALFSLPVLLGILLITFWVISDHIIYSWNISILWANPFWILTFHPKFNTKYWVRFVSKLLLISALITSVCILQSLAISLFVVTLGTRILFQDRFIQ